jgi:hypothetical protein
LLHILDRLRFAPYFGEAFAVDPDPDRSAHLELVDVWETSPQRGACPALVFRCPDESPVTTEWGVHRVQHGELGRFTVVLAPIDPLEAGYAYYRAVIAAPPADLASYCGGSGLFQAADCLDARPKRVRRR